MELHFNAFVLLKMYFLLGVLLSMGFLFVQVYQYVAGKMSLKTDYGQLLGFSYFGSLLAIIISFVFSVLLKKNFIKPTAQIWSEINVNPHYSSFITYERKTNLAVSFADQVVNVPTLSMWIILGFFLVGVFCFLALALYDFWVIRGFLKNALFKRSIGSMKIIITPRNISPFSFWVPGKYFVIMPENLLQHFEVYKTAIYHEFQHHRQGDTKWLYFVYFLKALFFWNPLMHLWERSIFELQEFACDEILTGRKKISTHVYCRSLVKVAESIMREPSLLAGTASFARSSAKKTLKRRIRNMVDTSSRKLAKKSLLYLVGTSFVFMVATGFVLQSSVQDRRITMDDAKRLGEEAQVNSNFPIVVNDLVLAELNLFIGTPEGREFMRLSLARMENYRDMVAGQLAEYRLPEELMAIPIIESGYQNIRNRNSIERSAGLWQFIGPTARTYGLRVDNEVDERLNERIETNAAMRYLGSLFYQFQDWPLAILAYNSGESWVQKWIKEEESRDAWELIRKGHENDKAYLARVMAAIIIMKNPSGLE